MLGNGHTFQTLGGVHGEIFIKCLEEGSAQRTSSINVSPLLYFIAEESNVRCREVKELSRAAV